MLAAVANCGRSRKWLDRGRLVLGFKPRHGSHAASFWDYLAWAETTTEGTMDWAEGEEGLWVCGYSKGLWDLNEDIKSLLLSLYNSLNK